MAWDDANELKVFAGRHAIDLAERVCEHLEIPLGSARTEVFPDGELIVHTEEDVRGRDCFVILSTCDPVNDNLMELLIFADSLRRASARRITAVVPYFGYARQDRKERGRTPITAKLTANLITTAGYTRVLALDLHAAQIQGFFDLPVDHLTAGAIFHRHFSESPLEDLVVVSPDVGNVKVANQYAALLGGELAIIHKKRLSSDSVQSSTIIGDVQGRTVLMVDDMISTGSTICEAATLLKANGAGRILVAATHAVLVGNALEKLAASPISELVVTNSIPPGDRFEPMKDRVKVLCVGKLFADAISHIHHNKSVSALFRQFAETKR
ncbi:MAG: ribose-phosphate pyrophosphokinase [Planctomycetota bacterium]